jgi:hypothetical protein
LKLGAQRTCDRGSFLTPRPPLRFTSAYFRGPAEFKGRYHRYPEPNSGNAAMLTGCTRYNPSSVQERAHLDPSASSISPFCSEPPSKKKLGADSMPASNSIPHLLMVLPIFGSSSRGQTTACRPTPRLSVFGIDHFQEVLVSHRSLMTKGPISNSFMLS